MDDVLFPQGKGEKDEEERKNTTEECQWIRFTDVEMELGGS